MLTQPRKYIAVLGNVDRSIMAVKLGEGFEIEEWPVDQFYDFYGGATGSSEGDIKFKIEEIWGYGHGRSMSPSEIYLIVKDLPDYPAHAKNESSVQMSTVFQLQSVYESRVSLAVAERILCLRLVAPGAIKTCAEFFCDEEFGDYSSSETNLHCENRPFRLKASHLDQLRQLFSTQGISGRHQYLRLALDNFSHAFCVAQPHLEFITLMICLEAIFNDGRTELRNKVARGCAVLLGASPVSSRRVFREVRELYDKRSALVHSGDTTKIGAGDTAQLLEIVRESLLRAVLLDLPKDVLVSGLNELGFGQRQRLTRRREVQQHDATQ